MPIESTLYGISETNTRRKGNGEVLIGYATKPLLLLKTIWVSVSLLIQKTH
jgi:hypothetical protein